MTEASLRQLGCSESPFASFAQHEGKKQLAQTAVAIASFTCSYDTDTFRDAVASAVLTMKSKYAALQCGIKQLDDGQYHFVESASEDSGFQFVSMTSEADAWSLFEKQAQSGVPEFEELLYQVTLIHIAQSQQYFLIANAHHSLADGFVYDKILGEILSLSKEFIATGKTSEELASEERPLVAPVEVFFKSDLTKWSMFKLMLRMTWRSIGRGKTIYILDKNKNAPWQQRYGVYSRVQYTSDKLAKLKDQARSHQTTINGCISAAMILAFDKIRTPSEEKQALRVGHAVDLRRRLPMDETLQDNLFCAASGTNTYHEAGMGSDFWTLARDVKQNLHDEIEVHRTPWRVLAAMKEAPDLFKWADEPYSGRSETLGISNIGLVKSCQAAQCDDLQIDSMYIAGSIQIAGALVSVIVTTINDALCFSFMGCHPLLTQSELDAFATDVLANLDNS